MAKIAICMADGCEEIEALTVVDVIRRAQMEIVMLSVGGSRKVTGSHGIAFETDDLIDNVNWDEIDGIVLPGGMPGTTNLDTSDAVARALEFAKAHDLLICAICAAPSVLGHKGLLSGKEAICFPGFESELSGATLSKNFVCRDGNIITAKGMGVATEFALAIASALAGVEAAEKVRAAIQFPR